MEYILVLLIVALLNGAIAYIDGLMEGIIPLTLYAEQYMSTLAGVDLFQSLFDIVFGFGVSLIVLKFLKKGFETYVLWSDGDADEEPIAILTNFFKAMAVAICFPTMYDWLATIVEEMSNKMLEAIGLATAYDWAGWVSGISSMGLVTAIFGLVFVIVYFILYFQFLMRGLEILILRVGIPLACVGLIDNDKGVFKPYMSKFFQSALSVIIQIALAKLGVGLMMNMHIFWGVACMILAVRTPKFLQEFIVTTGGGAVHRLWNKAALSGIDWLPGDGRRGRPGLAVYRQCDYHRSPGADRYLWLGDDDHQGPAQFVRGGSGAEPGPVPERAENLPVPLRGRMGA